MSYDYRVLKHKRTEDDFYYAVHEVYYGSDNKPISFSNDPVFPWGEDVETFEIAMKKYNSALDKHILLINDNDELIEIED